MALGHRTSNDVVVKLVLVIILTFGPGVTRGFKAAYSRNAIILPSPAVEKTAMEGVSNFNYKSTNDWTLTIVTPIALGIFVLVVIFFCWVFFKDSVGSNNGEEGDFQYQGLPDEEGDRSDVEDIHNVVARPHPVIDQILDMPYTVPGASSSSGVDEQHFVV